MVRARYRPSPGAFGVPDSLVCAVEAIKNMGQVTRVNPRALVADHDDHLLRADFTRNPNFAARGIFDGV